MMKPNFFKSFIKALTTGVLCCLILSCQGSSERKNLADSTKMEGQYCFRNETAFDNKPEVKDIEELSLSIQDKKVTGSYNWLPAYKDKREGSIEGFIRNDTIMAQYRFFQEGQRDTVSLQIVLGKNKAIIKGGNPSLGLSQSIAKIDCGK